MKHKVYTPYDQPAKVMEEAVEHLMSRHPGARIEITRMEITAGLPKNDYGQTIDITYRIVTDDDPRHGPVFFAS